MSAPTSVYIEDGIVKLSSTDEAVVCSWFANCDNDANNVIDHPSLGGVPICEHCESKINR